MENILKVIDHPTWFDLVVDFAFFFLFHRMTPITAGEPRSALSSINFPTPAFSPNILTSFMGRDHKNALFRISLWRKILSSIFARASNVGWLIFPQLKIETNFRVVFFLLTNVIYFYWPNKPWFRKNLMPVNIYWILICNYDVWQQHTYLFMSYRLRI